MLTDFCNALWDTRIESDTVSSDGYEVCNLISRDTIKKQRGFLAARFVKPVVSLLVSFPFPVDVCAINVNPKVGGQKTVGLEILSASLECCSVQNKRAKSSANPNNCDSKSTLNPNVGKDVKEVFHSYKHSLNVNNIKQEFSSFFNQILRVRIVEGKVGHFSNLCFRDADSDSRILSSSPDNVQSSNLQQGNRLHNTSHLWVRITQVHKGSVPCLGAIEVFGKPARNSSDFVVNYARIITLKLKKEREKPVCRGFVSTSAEANLSESNAHKSENNPCNSDSLFDSIPTEFIDPITYNIMTLPILLPSGTTIDNSTLEKHIVTEQKWGRQPSDPFTGVPLGSKVVPNAALKYRIDNFLLSSDAKVDELGRTVGSSSDCISTAKLKFDAILKENREKINPAKRKASTLVFKQPPLKKQNAEHNQHVSGKPNSLDQALENVLNFGQKSSISSPSVTPSSLVPSSFLDQNESEPQKIESSDPAMTSNHGCPHQEQTSVLFQIRCQHVICRQCLTCALATKQCLYCQTNFEKKDVIRVHSRNKACS